MRIVMIVLVFGLWTSSSNAKEAMALEFPLTKDFQALQNQTFQPTECKGVLEKLHSDLATINFDSMTNEQLGKVGPSWIEQSLQVRLALHQKLPAMTKECVLETRDLFHKLRDLEDYLAEFAAPTQSLDPKTLDFQKQPVPILDRNAYPSMFVRDDQPNRKFEFHSGDLMLARGVSFVSAIITQVSTNRSHFSHVVTVHVDPKTHQESTIESYIGSGVEKFDIEFALKNENARLLVLRPKNGVLAARAADLALIAAAKRLPYDYQMDYVDSKAMSCVEVPVFAFAQASEGKLRLPTDPSAVAIKNPEFLNRFGLRTGLIRTPDDLETDPNFDLLLDWKDLRLIRDSRHKDALLAEMVRWISELKYNFHDNSKSYAAMYFLKPARSTFLWPTIQKITKAPNFDREVPRKTFGLMVLINEVGEILLKELRAQDQKHFAEHRRPMTNAQLRQALEAYRRADLEKFKNTSKSDFHNILRASERDF